MMIKLTPDSLIIIIALCFNQSCKTQTPSKLDATNNITQSNPYWTEHIKQSNNKLKQLNCEPTVYEPQGPKRGTVILLHGFTACPQQFFHLGNKLSQVGYKVYLPLLPGHGLEQYASKEYEDLPTLKNYEGTFNKYVDSIQNIASYEKSNVSIGGISLGGMLAVNALSKYPEVFNKGLILTPFFKIKGNLAFVMGGVKNVHNISGLFSNPGKYMSTAVENHELSWGEGCVYERSLSRAGYCEFTMGNLAAIQQYGITSSRLTLDKDLVMQFVAVEKDSAVSNTAIQDFLVNKKSISSCAYRFPANHSLVSEFDSPDQEKFWLPSLERSIEDFFIYGEKFKTTQRSLDGFNECFISKLQ